MIELEAPRPVCVLIRGWQPACLTRRRLKRRLMIPERSGAELIIWPGQAHSD